MNNRRKINDIIFVICGTMYTRASRIIFPKDLRSLNILRILNALIIVAAVEISKPINIFNKNPMSVPMTIQKSNLFHEFLK